MYHSNESLLIFEQELELIEKELKGSVIRTANSRKNPQNPLRPGKEITYDPMTKEQKSAFLSLSEEYDLKVYEIVSKGSATEVMVSSEEEAILLNGFASKICELVIKDYPDIDGVDESINADAEMIVYMISNILSEAGFDI